MVAVRAAQSTEIDQVRELFREYAAWLGEGICFESFEQEVAGLPGSYAPPRGALLVAVHEDRVEGCVTLRELDRDTGEMKRLFLREPLRGTGAGLKLVEAVIEE